MTTIYVDNQPYTIPVGQNVLQACLSLGFDIPYFCWHPAMHSVGACRLCAVKMFSDEKDTRGKIVMSCMTYAHDGIRISVKDPEAVRFRQQVIEWLMTNHPHDCPICDEGGECHLQDMTLMTGHIYRRYRFKKRTYRNQNLGPFIRHEMNRCIQCYRCVRFYRDYAGGRDLEVLGWHNRVYFGRHEEGVLKSKFSGNLVEVCPTGVFTDKTFAAHYTRKWDLQTAPSVCVHCGIGCNTLPGERYGVLRRIQNRYHQDVNRYFLCDRGRFGYEFVNHPHRFKHPQVRQTDGRCETADKSAIPGIISQAIKTSAHAIGVGSPRASLESNYALRDLVGPENFYIGVSGTESDQLTRLIRLLSSGPVRSASLQDVAQADAVLILGEDVSQVAPMLELSLRRSILRKPSQIATDLHIHAWNDAAVREALQSRKGPLFIAVTGQTDLDDAAAETYHAAPDNIARLGFAVAHKLHDAAPAVADLSHEVDALAGRIAEQLKDARRPLILSGTTGGSVTIIEAAMNVALAMHHINPNTEICMTVPHCNSLGLGLMAGRPLEQALDALRGEPSTTVIILENDLYRHLSVTQADKLLQGANTVVCLDHLLNRTTEHADVILPAATFAESSGTLVNNEGRAQRFYKVFPPANDIQESWRWLSEIRTELTSGKKKPWENLDAVIRDMAADMPVFAPVKNLAPTGEFRIVGQKIPRQTHRFSGRTAIHAGQTVHEPQPPADPDSPLAFSMEGYPGQPPATLLTHFWAPRWNSVQSVNKFQSEVGGPLRNDSAGRRLIEPQPGSGFEYFTAIPPVFKRRPHSCLAVPAWHVFGSDELSMMASAVAELAAKPYLAVHPENVHELPVDEQGNVEVELLGVSYYLPVIVSPTVPPGVVRAPMGLINLHWNGVPVWCQWLKK